MSRAADRETRLGGVLSGISEPGTIAGNLSAGHTAGNEDR